MMYIISMQDGIFIHTVYFYGSNGATTNFFDTKVIKDALESVLVAFYPVAGRLKEVEDGQIKIDCQGQGVLYVKAESDGVIDNFAPRMEYLELILTVDYSLGIESYPLLLVQRQDDNPMDRIKGCIMDSASVATPDLQASGFSAAILKKNSIVTKGYRNTNDITAKPAMTEMALLVVLEKFFDVILNLLAVN
uniref:Shikimate O-hydroxycinnamoyltransferase-like n=1 Tax=Tanacetum cinerariifolium TaxID=118510 RepID=A0A6L2JSD4_TANCI|nr:shikimate O-hydroxycinnamoyltransferase-like [Tanacetum cinerariifolium]